MGLIPISDVPKQYKHTRPFVSRPGKSRSYLGPPEYLHTWCVTGQLIPVPSVAVRYFLKNKVSPDLCNEDGLTALHQVRPGPLESPGPCSPPGQVPCPLLFPAQNTQGGGREGKPQLPHLRSSCLLWRHAYLLQTHPQSSRARTRGTHTASEDRESLSTASSLPSQGVDKQSKFVWSLTVCEAHLFTPTKTFIHPVTKVIGRGVM